MTTTAVDVAYDFLMEHKEFDAFELNLELITEGFEFSEDEFNEIVDQARQRFADEAEQAGRIVEFLCKHSFKNLVDAGDKLGVSPVEAMAWAVMDTGSDDQPN